MSIIPVELQAEPRATINVGYQEVRPYSFTDSAGTPQGFSIDILERLADYSGYELRFMPYNNPKDMLEALRAGDIQATTLLAETDVRREIGNYTAGISTFDTAIFVLESSAFWETSELTGRRIGAITGSFSIVVADKVPFADVVIFDTPASMLVALLSGAVDAVVVPQVLFLEELHLLGLTQRVRSVGEPLTRVPLSFVIAPTHENVLRDFNNAIVEQITPAVIEALGRKWFEKAYSSAQNTKHWIWIAIFGSMALGAVFVLLLQPRNVRRPFSNDRNNHLLISALNKVDLCIVIYNENLRTVHWNETMAFTFPKLLPHLKKGAKLTELISISYHIGQTAQPMNKQDANEFAQQIVENMYDGNDTTRIVQMSDGRIFEAVEFAFGTDLYASVRKDVTQGQRQANQIKEQNLKLAVANERMQHFAEMAAHDLRAPLHHQSSLLDFIAEDLKDAGVELPADVDEYIQMSKVSVTRMQTLVDDLLEYARLESVCAETGSANLQDRFFEVLQLIHIPDGFEIVCSGDLPDIQVPDVACDIVLRNLISNALKHHDKTSGKVTVSAEVMEDQVFVDITDDGPGIPPELTKKIFDPFEQCPGSGTKVRGSGLGLAMVARTVQSWGGDIQVLDAAGSGSIFRFSAPLAYEQFKDIGVLHIEHRKSGIG